MCPRHGGASGREVRGYVRQSLYRGLRGVGAEGGAEAARSGLPGRSDPAPRFGRVCTLKQTILFLVAGALAFSQSQVDTKQRVRAAHDLAKQGEQGITSLAAYVTD